MQRQLVDTLHPTKVHKHIKDYFMLDFTSQYSEIEFFQRYKKASGLLYKLA